MVVHCSSPPLSLSLLDEDIPWPLRVVRRSVVHGGMRWNHGNGRRKEGRKDHHRHDHPKSCPLLLLPPSFFLSSVNVVAPAAAVGSLSPSLRFISNVDSSIRRKLLFRSVVDRPTETARDPLRQHHQYTVRPARPRSPSIESSSSSHQIYHSPVVHRVHRVHDQLQPAACLDNF